MTTRMLAEDFECHHRTIENILHEAGKTWRKSKWIPHELTETQKKRRFEKANEFIQRNNRAPFLENIVTGDEKWIPFKNPNHHNQWLSPGQASIATPVDDFRQEKRLLSVFWDRRHVIHWEVLEKGQTINSELYGKQLSRLHRKMRNRKDQVILLDDNARPHTANLIRNKIAEFGWERLDHPAYSPDLAPSDFHLFRALEHFLRGKRFQNIEEMRMSLGQFFESKTQQFYGRGIQLLPEKWQQVIDLDGEYLD